MSEKVVAPYGKLSQTQTGFDYTVCPELSLLARTSSIAIMQSIVPVRVKHLTVHIPLAI